MKEIGFAIVNRGRRSLLVVPALLLGAAAAHATDPPTIDYAAIATSARDGVVTAVSGYAPIVMLLAASMIGLGLLYKWFKKSAKSS